MFFCFQWISLSLIHTITVILFFTHCQLLTPTLIQSYTLRQIHSLTHSFKHFFTYSVSHSNIHGKIRTLNFTQSHLLITHSQTHSYILTHSYFHSHTFTLSFAQLHSIQYLSLNPTHSLIYTFSHSVIQTHSLMLTHTFTQKHSRTLILRYTQTHIQYTHTHFH